MQFEEMKSLGKKIPVLIDDKNYDEGMQQKVEPYLAKLCIKGYVSREKKLYYELYPQENSRGTIVLLHGFTESLVKFHELIYYFHRAGYQVAALDHRGHGKSFREISDPNIVHISHFGDYIEDLHDFIHQAVLKKLTVDKARFFIFGHSMGGCIAARYIEVYPDEFAAAILNAPMTGINYAPFPAWSASIICYFFIAIGKGKERIFNQSNFSPKPDHAGAASSSEARYMYYHRMRVADKHLQTSCADYYWGIEATKAGALIRRPEEESKIQIPVLILMAEKDTLVDLDTQRAFASLLKEGRALIAKKARHEIYGSPNEIVGPYLENLLDFLETARS